MLTRFRKNVTYIVSQKLPYFQQEIAYVYLLYF